MKKLKMIKYMIILLFLSSCAQERHKELNIDYRIQEYVNSFKQDANDVGYSITIDNLIIKVEYSADKRSLGSCTLGDYTPKITISPDNNLTEYNYDVESLVYHELGHCVLKLKHDDSIDPVNYYPNSLMHTYHFDGNLYARYRMSYVKQLFFGGKNEF